MLQIVRNCTLRYYNIDLWLIEACEELFCYHSYQNESYFTFIRRSIKDFILRSVIWVTDRSVIVTRLQIMLSDYKLSCTFKYPTLHDIK